VVVHKFKVIGEDAMLKWKYIFHTWKSQYLLFLRKLKTSSAILLNQVSRYDWAFIGRAALLMMEADKEICTVTSQF
jgi:hypothetical protein